MTSIYMNTHQGNRSALRLEECNALASATATAELQKTSANCRNTECGPMCLQACARREGLSGTFSLRPHNYKSAMGDSRYRPISGRCRKIQETECMTGQWGFTLPAHPGFGVFARHPAKPKRNPNNEVGNKRREALRTMSSHM